MKSVCPLPGIWRDVVTRLESAASGRGIDERPPTPLILGGWTYSNDVEKKARWEATLAWARKHGLESEIQVEEEHFHKVEELYDGMVGPVGGPMYLPWRSDASPVPDHKFLDQRLAVLKLAWRTLTPLQVTAATQPTGFTGKKGRRLEVLVQDRSVVPPWGTWTSLGPDPNRRTFTAFRQNINQTLAPHFVDHVGFVDSTG